MGKKKLIYGIGINDADYNITEHDRETGKRIMRTCSFYWRWCSMLRRCYSVKFLEKNPTYKDCYVCDEWLTFSNFKSWMEQQDYEGKQLDKDLLVYQNKIYSPETCVFVPREINQFLPKSDARRGLYPLGVSYRIELQIERSKPFVSMISKNGATKFLGYYETPEEAHRAWQKAKIERAITLVEKQTDVRIIAGLRRIINKIQYDYDNNLETVDF